MKEERINSDIKSEQNSSDMKEEMLSKIYQNFRLSEKDKQLISECFKFQLNLPRLEAVLDTMIEYHMQNDILTAYILFQVSKIDLERANLLAEKYLNEENKKLYNTFIVLKDVRALTRSGEVDSIRKMFVAIAQDMRIVLVKFATILYDLRQLELPISQEDKDYVVMVNDIFAPLAERLGLMSFKFGFEDKSFELLQPEAFKELSSNELLQTSANSEQIAITKAKLEKILEELKIKGDIQARQKHISSIYKKLLAKNSKLENIYDIIAMRVIVPKIEDCYSVLGKIHAIYKPISFRVKDMIANPKPNGYQSLHTTIIAENNRPLEIQIRTFEMHKYAEYGIAAHWIYKEKRTQNASDQKMSWFRHMMENSKELSSEEFIQNLKINLYGELIFVQTPKGKVLELPQGSSAIDFAYNIHSEIGNTCVGAKVNGKIVPITYALQNGDIVEILTNPNSKGPSRDWLLNVKTASARSKIKSFFKTQLKDENIRLGKSVIEQAIKAKNINITKQEKEDFLLKIANSLVMDDLDTLYAEVGAGSLSINSVIGRLVNLYNKEKSLEIKEDVITIKRNKDGILIDGDSGLMVRYAGCCSPVMGDEIVGYISRGRGVTIHRSTCQNIKYLEPERLIRAEWQDLNGGNFTAVIKIHTDINNTVVNNLNNIAREFKNKFVGFAYKQIKDELVFDIIVNISNKSELDKIIAAFQKVKSVRKIYRSE